MIRWPMLLKLGLSLDQAAHFLGISLEDLEAQIQADEDRRTAPGRQLMTPVLARPEMDRWEWRRADRG